MAAPTPSLPPALWDAVIKGDLNEARQLLAGGANVDERGGEAPHLCTSLQVAVPMGDTEMVQLLLEHGADESAVVASGRTPLAQASYFGNEAVALVFLEKGVAGVSAKDTVGMTPLHWAALKGQSEVVRVLIELRANVSAEDNSGQIPVEMASA